MIELNETTTYPENPDIKVVTGTWRFQSLNECAVKLNELVGNKSLITAEMRDGLQYLSYTDGTEYSVLASYEEDQ